MTTTLSDDEIVGHLETAGVKFQRFKGGISGAKDCWSTSGSQDVRKLANGIRSILAKLQATQAEPVQAGELPPYIYGREAGPNEKVWTEQAVRAAIAARKPDDAVLRERIRIGISLALNDLHAPVHKPSAEILEASEQGGDDQWAIEDGDYYPLIQPDANGNTVEFTRAPVIVNPAQEAVNPGPFLASVLVMGHHIEVSAPPGQPIQTGMLGVIRNAVVSYFTTGAATQNPAQAGWSQAGELPDEREAFEQFAQNCPMGRYSINRRGDGYDSSHTQIMWDAWQARAALTARKPLTRKRINEASRDAQISFCLKSGGTYEEELARAIERAHGIGLEVKP